MTEKIENETLATSLNAKLEKSKGTVLAVAIVALVVIIAVAAIATIKAKSTEKGLELFDSISYTLTDKANELSSEDLASRQSKALEELSSLASKGGIVGLRANMLIAEIKFSQKNYEEARAAWLKAISAKGKNYTTSLCYYNAAVCSEELNDTEKAISYYKAASDDEDFLLIDHALFSLGRVNEGAEKYTEAKAAYEKLFELRGTSNWGQLAKSRLIALKTEGKIE